jgi:hypothetical protein
MPEDVKSANVQEGDDLLICIFIGKAHADDVSFPEAYSFWSDPDLSILQDMQAFSSSVQCPYSGVCMP